ncbi:hypothetical protein CA51_13500 [Rosistilla oblonga]|uniref:hypothetical protein n=1 Tax=Rosistilla oblonga TaxID=2527990 RepID=UPI00118781DD|nr:hypothetical protein [Rosistilla oblonga]QDV11486.1 hypothetical protein CA51_13500 [Rosistilla oblonga]
MKNISITAVLFLFVFIAGCGGSSLPTGDEARGRLSEVERTRTEQNQRIASLESELTKSREANHRLQAELAAAEGGKGFEMEEKQRILDGRKAALDTLETQLLERETAIIDREESIVKLENDFYRKTNDSMTDIGEARHVKTEYENMRQEKDDAVATAEFWLMFVWGVSIAFAVALLAIVLLLYRSVSMHAIQRREIQHRQQVVDLLSTSVAARLPADDAATVVDALQRISQSG